MRKTILAGTVGALLLVIVAFVVPSPGAQQIHPRPAPGSTVQVAVPMGDAQRLIHGVLENFDRNWLAITPDRAQAPAPGGGEIDLERAEQVIWVPMHAVIFIRVFEEE